MPKILFCHHCYSALRSRSKVGVKLMGKGKMSDRQMFVCAPVIRLDAGDLLLIC